MLVPTLWELLITPLPFALSLSKGLSGHIELMGYVFVCFDKLSTSGGR